MPTVRLLNGTKAGHVIEAHPEDVSLWVNSGQAELVIRDEPETPERVAIKTRKARSGLETR